jgi:hypothetical protein
VKFCHDLPINFIYKNVVNKLRFLLITHMTCFDIRFGCYGILKSGFSADQVLDRLGIQVLGHKMSKICCGQNTKSEGNKLSFQTPTRTHVFDNCSNSYGRLSTAHVKSSAGR